MVCFFFCTERLGGHSVVWRTPKSPPRNASRHLLASCPLTVQLLGDESTQGLANHLEWDVLKERNWQAGGWAGKYCIWAAGVDKPSTAALISSTPLVCLHVSGHHFSFHLPFIPILANILILYVNMSLCMLSNPANIWPKSLSYFQVRRRRDMTPKLVRGTRGGSLNASQG